MNNEKKCKVLIDDPAGRFKKGEIGVITEEYENQIYKYEVLLPGEIEVNFFTGKNIKIQRLFSFYKEEIEVVQNG